MNLTCEFLHQVTGATSLRGVLEWWVSQVLILFSSFAFVQPSSHSWGNRQLPIHLSRSASHSSLQFATSKMDRATNLFAIPTTDKLPETDDERLVFYAELLTSNLPSLIADLSSAKYAFLSFSEKTRNEVKQKAALLQSVGRTVGNCLTAYKNFQNRQKRLEQCEVQLLSAAPPRFLTPEEALNEKMKSPANSNSHIVVLPVEDLLAVREAERNCEDEIQRFATRSKEVNELEKQLEQTVEQCQEVNSHVQKLKRCYEEVSRTLQHNKCSRAVVLAQMDEFKNRQNLIAEVRAALKDTMQQCRAEELEIIQCSIDKAQAEAASMREELCSRRERHEVELAAYQIACKEEEASTDSLKDSIAYLKKHQLDLEFIAKKQQLQEATKNSLKKLVMSSLGRATEENKALTPEQEEELKADHPLVSVHAARISVMLAQRNEVGGILVQAGNVYEKDIAKNALDRIRNILKPDICLDNEALASVA